MNAWARFTFSCILGAVCTTSAADSPRTEFEQSFIGREWMRGRGPIEKHELTDQCDYQGGSLLVQDNEVLDDFGMDELVCDGQRFILLEQLTRTVAHSNNIKIKVLDALLLPKLKKGEKFMDAGDCQFNGKAEMSFTALVSLGKRDKATWKTGVHAAWRPNPETGKFEELSTKNIVCWRPTPP